MTRKLFLLLICVAVALQALAWKPLFVGHRGCYIGLENSVEAYRNGVDIYGYDALECDVRVTADGQYVISHDETTNRLGGNLTVANATLAQLKAETLRQKRGDSTYTGHICTVAEYLDICVEKGVFPVIELKWTTGINNNDMSNFPGLAQLVKEHGLAAKAVFITSMKKSLEYVRTHYPEFKCQFLCSTAWKGNEQWCKQYDLEPTIAIGNYDIHTVKTFRNLGLRVACWTVDSRANYLSVGKMGTYMITCNSLRPADMPELDSIDWDDVDDVLDPLELKIDTVFSHTRFNGTLPTHFPSGVVTESAFNTAQQAVARNGVFYANDYKTSTLLTFDASGRVPNAYQGTNSHGIALDDAGNLILRADGITKTPAKFLVYPAGSTVGHEVSFSLNHPAQTNFITASGDVCGNEGGLVYFYPNGMKSVDFVRLVDGDYAGTTSTAPDELSVKGTTASMVYPIDGTAQKFIYQVRGNGFYFFNKGDQGIYITGRSSTTAPARNTSVGGAYFTLSGHKLFVHPSGTNYNGGFTVRDMNAGCKALLTVPPMGNGGYSANPSTGSFFSVQAIDSHHCYLYEYCMGNGYAQYQLYVGEPYVPSAVAAVTSDEVPVEVARYNLAGLRLTAPAPGVNIVRLSDGSARKQLVH